MNRTQLLQRIHQLLAIDMNAEQIYTDLAENSTDEHMKSVFSGIARDEKRHVALSRKILSLLGESDGG